MIDGVFRDLDELSDGLKGNVLPQQHGIRINVGSGRLEDISIAVAPGRGHDRLQVEDRARGREDLGRLGGSLAGERSASAAIDEFRFRLFELTLPITRGQRLQEAWGHECPSRQA